MNRTQLLSTLSGVVDRVTKTALKTCRPMVLSKKQSIVGNISVERNNDATYALRKSQQIDPLYSDIMLYETAILLAQSHICNNTVVIKELLDLDKRYRKYHTDMVNYLACYKILRTHKEFDRMLILEDKFILSDEIIKSIKYQINCIRNNAYRRHS